MLRIIVSRLLQGVAVMIGATLIVFLASYLTGDPAALMMGDTATPEQIEEFRALRGLDRPWYILYAEFLVDLVQGDLGTSIYYNQPNASLILQRLPATLKLAAAALGLALVLAIPLGVLAALKRGTWIDTVVTSLAVAGQSMPNFWLAIMMIFYFGVSKGWLPVSGSEGLECLIMPCITLMMLPLAQNMRMMRSAMLEVLGDEYIKLARSKGLRDMVVTWKHTLKNAIRPVITQVGLQMGSFLGGAVITETIFSWPGIGRLSVTAICVGIFRTMWFRFPSLYTKNELTKMQISLILA